MLAHQALELAHGLLDEALSNSTLGSDDFDSGDPLVNDGAEDGEELGTGITSRPTAVPKKGRGNWTEKVCKIFGKKKNEKKENQTLAREWKGGREKRRERERERETAISKLISDPVILKFQDDVTLRRVVEQHQARDVKLKWKKIAVEAFGSLRTSVQCRSVS